MGRQQIAALTDFLDRASLRFSHLSSTLPRDGQNHAQYHLIGLNLTINAFARSIVALARNGHSVAVSPVLRAMLEAHVDVVNLIRDPGYFYQLRHDYLNRFLRSMSKPIPGDISMQTARENGLSAENWLAKLKTEQDNLEALGYATLKVEEKFRLADMKLDYFGIYAQLCAETHNRLDAVWGRLSRDELDAGYAMLGIDHPQSALEIEMTVSAEILCRTNAALHQKLETKSQALCADFLLELRSIWRDTSPHA